MMCVGACSPCIVQFASAACSIQGCRSTHKYTGSDCTASMEVRWGCMMHDVLQLSPGGSHNTQVCTCSACAAGCAAAYVAACMCCWLHWNCTDCWVQHAAQLLRVLSSIGKKGDYRPTSAAQGCCAASSAQCVLYACHAMWLPDTSSCY